MRGGKFCVVGVVVLSAPFFLLFTYRRVCTLRAGCREERGKETRCAATKIECEKQEGGKDERRDQESIRAAERRRKRGEGEDKQTTHTRGRRARAEERKGGPGTKRIERERKKKGLKRGVKKTKKTKEIVIGTLMKEG